MQLSKSGQQLWLLTILSMISSIGISLPYPIFAPMLLQAGANSIIPSYWPNSSHEIILGVTLAVYPFGLFLANNGVNHRY